jgi:hypothetical protein
LDDMPRTCCDTSNKSRYHAIKIRTHYLPYNFNT